MPGKKIFSFQIETFLEAQILAPTRKNYFLTDILVAPSDAKMN